MNMPQTDENVSTLVKKIVSEIQSSMLHMQLQKAAWDEVAKPSLRLSDLKKGVITELTKSGWEKKLRNAVYKCMQKYPSIPQPLTPAESVKEPVSYIRRAQMNWEKRILKSLNSMCTELGVPLARKRPDKEQKELASKWSEMGTDEPDLSQFRPVYAPKDFLEVIASLRNTNLMDGGDITVHSSMWGILQVSLPVKDMHELVENLRNTSKTDSPLYVREITIREHQDDILLTLWDNSAVYWHAEPGDEVHIRDCLTGYNTFKDRNQITIRFEDQFKRLQFSEMSINQSQGGVDDAPELYMEYFEQGRSKLAKKVIAAQHSPLAQEFAKKGCPVSNRGQIWCQILNVQVDDVDVLYYEQLKNNVLQHDLLVDNLIYKDVKLTATNDDQYFVFEDYLYQMLLPFSRDTAVLEHFRYSSASPAKSYIRGKLGMDEYAVNYPPNGVIPFHGFAMYVAPLCYVYNDPVTLYYVFREFYIRYFTRLHTLSSHPQGIVSLSLLFEQLLQTHEPQLFYHLKTVGVQPLRLAFKWLIRAFSGYLASEQVLLLWDRILAYNSLELLAVLAMAIFSFRRANLLQVQTFNAAEAVLADVTSLKVIPLIQLTLFSE